MSTAELKQNIFYKLTFINDENLLLEIEKLLNTSQNKEFSNWNDLSENHKIGILDAIDEMNNSSGISHESVIEKYKNKYA